MEFKGLADKKHSLNKNITTPKLKTHARNIIQELKILLEHTHTNKIKSQITLGIHFSNADSVRTSSVSHIYILIQ